MNAKQLIETQDLFEMANVTPKRTGLPFNIWISAHTGDRHVPRLKVEVGRRNFIPVTIELKPRQLAGEPQLSSRDLASLGRFIGLNQELLLDYWFERTTDTGDVINNLKKL